MSKRRKTKKQIRLLSQAVVNDCLSYLEMHPERDNTEVLEIIDDVQELEQELVMRISHIDGAENPKLVKAYFKKIAIDLHEGINGAFNDLSEIVKEKK